MEIDIEDAVPGDVVKLASGDMLPGDVRFIETKDLFIDQSQLTGESNPIEKFAGPDPEGDDITELDNIGFMGSNIISGSAKAVIAGNKKYYELIADKVRAYAAETGYDIKAKKQGSSLVIEVKGVAAHGARPHLGLNSISIMMEFLGRVSFANEELNDYIAFYNEHIGFDLHGERFGIKFEDNQSGPLILNVGIANINEELATVSINIRFPVTYSDVDLVVGMDSCIKDTSIGIITRMVQNPIYMELDSPMVTKLLKAYRDETGDKETPASVQSGGTYAKMVNNILCFGALFPGEEDTMHQAGEKLSVESFMKMARIYARAIHALCCE
jgi:succinyl-diaminopimelate desuccinylase